MATTTTPKAHVKFVRVGKTMSTPIAGSSIQLDDTDTAMVLNRLTTTQRNALTPVAGMIIYNTTTNAINIYNGTSWLAVTAA